MIRNIKKGYKVVRVVTNSIDIIDKHYNSTKFEEIKKELESNEIRCFGYSNLNEYIRNKKFVSPFTIVNYDEKYLLAKYIKQLQCKSKLIVFCNKNKITAELEENKLFSFVSSHFGKIIKYIKQTLVYQPVINREED
jgi:DeoR/GlpR family transcriptional regulator of sugar metabolism